jgi:hypothetical protein
MSTKIDQEVLDELIAMLEDHIAGGLKPESAAEPVAEEAVEPEGEEVAAEPQEDDEDMAALMEMYSKG